MSEQSSSAADDPIAAAFEQMRAQAKRRGGYVPRLNAKARSMDSFESPASSDAKAQPRPPIGRPTGKDGRALPKASNVKGIGQVIQREIRRRGWQKEMASALVFGHWEELVGEQVAKHTKVEMVKDKKLFLSCDSTAWASNLRLMQRQILQKINAEVGPDIITELRIFGPKTPSWRHGPLHVKGRGPRDTYG
ncbi:MULTISPECIES: DciA family protein [Corynebacterium]|uniref:Uncharacterized protein n=2 Tax=Corynebacterium TaxID=1716 RepID=A0A3G6IU58_9CORY|nr:MULTISPECIES: DciA family protein [Corynebacterium]AZA08158.1 hypothetical protein CPPEL_00020 [Corynebacterium pseudopelargi]QAU51311.1 hypothetical protein CPELA_00020 [Corynebacterium pelargi]GGG81818.1 UPF0232 protein Cgl0005/cg0006 [Corynebacterium pelargi]